MKWSFRSLLRRRSKPNKMDIKDLPNEVLTIIISLLDCTSICKYAFLTAFRLFHFDTSLILVSNTLSIRNFYFIAQIIKMDYHLYKTLLILPPMYKVYCQIHWQVRIFKMLPQFFLLLCWKGMTECYFFMSIPSNFSLNSATARYLP